MAVDQREALIAAVRAQVEKERAKMKKRDSAVSFGRIAYED